MKRLSVRQAIFLAFFSITGLSGCAHSGGGVPIRNISLKGFPLLTDSTRIRAILKMQVVNQTASPVQFAPNQLQLTIGGRTYQPEGGLSPGEAITSTASGGVRRTVTTKVIGKPLPVRLDPHHEFFWMGTGFILPHRLCGQTATLTVIPLKVSARVPLTC